MSTPTLKRQNCTGPDTATVHPDFSGDPWAQEVEGAAQCRCRERTRGSRQTSVPSYTLISDTCALCVISHYLCPNHTDRQTDTHTHTHSHRTDTCLPGVIQSSYLSGPNRMKPIHLAPCPLLSVDPALSLTSSFLALVWFYPLEIPGSRVDLFEDTTGNQKSKLDHVPQRGSQGVGGF